MEQNPPVLAKKVWILMRGVYLMIKKKGLLKRKLLLDLNMMIKKKLSHHHNRPPHDGHHLEFTSPPPGEYEFSCSNSPSTNNNNNPFSLFSIFHKKHHSTNQQAEEDLDITAINAAVLKAMEMIQSESTESPALPGFGRSPMVRQLRVTDSPFPLSGVDEDSHHVDEDSHHVDEAAEQFINRFYNNLRRQN